MELYEMCVKLFNMDTLKSKKQLVELQFFVWAKFKTEYLIGKIWFILTTKKKLIITY